MNAQRAKRIARYREKMVGRQSLWRVWRAQLPVGPQLRAAAMSRLKLWAGYLDPDFLHSERVAQLALLLYDGLKDAGLMTAGAVPGNSGAANFDPANSGPANFGPANREQEWRAVLQAAALMHDVGKAKGCLLYTSRCV